jgi:cytochrome c oxidase subunit I+III
MMIAIPNGVQVFCWIASIWNGAVRMTASFWFVIGAIITFVMGGVTGVMLASVPFDHQVHDTYFVVAHFHYVIFGSTIFPLFAGFYHWFPKLTGRMLSERLGYWHFGMLFVGTHLTFFPQHQLGLMGMPRRVFTYLDGLGWGGLNLLSTIGAFVVAASVLIFLFNVARGLRVGTPSGDDPWAADSLEWATASPPPAYNFATIPTVHGRYARWDAVPAGVVETLQLREDRREVVVTSLMDAIPEGRVVLPAPSLLPMWAALAVFFAFLGLIIHPFMIPLGLIAALAIFIRWNWPGAEDFDPEPHGSAESEEPEHAGAEERE